jgi:hypothetical protein
VSSGGGNEPRWRGDGKELFYKTADGQRFLVLRSVDGSRPPPPLAVIVNWPSMLKEAGR